MIHLPRSARYSLAPRLDPMRPHRSPTTARASTCRSSKPRARAARHVSLQATAGLTRCRTEPRRACAQAPGSSILGAWVGSSNTARAIASGTSMAAPHVSGVAAQLLAEDPTLSVARVKEVLLAAAEVGSIHLSANAVQGQTPNRLLIGGAGLRLFLNRPSPPPSPPMPPPSPPSPPSPPYCPVECGKPGHCTSEIAGFRDPNELHEVLFQRTPHALCVCSPRAPLPAATGAVLLQCQAFSSLGIPSEWLLCVGGVRCGLAVRTRQDICRGRGHLPIRRRQTLHHRRARGRLHRRHWM